MSARASLPCNPTQHTMIVHQALEQGRELLVLGEVGDQRNRQQRLQGVEVGGVYTVDVRVGHSQVREELEVQQPACQSLGKLLLHEPGAGDLAGGPLQDVAPHGQHPAQGQLHDRLTSILRAMGEGTGTGKVAVAAREGDLHGVVVSRLGLNQVTT